jgi:hypothetical protein
MKDEFVIFQKFNNHNSALEFGKLLNKNGIQFIIENISVNFDPILPNNEFGIEYCIKLQKSQFEIANVIVKNQVLKDLVEIDKDYYLLEFSNEELLDVIEKSDEWNKFDVELSKKLLNDRGIEIGEKELNEIKKKRITELSKPEKSQEIYVVLGYILAFFSGFIGLFIGWHLMTFKKTLPNGDRIYSYSKLDRNHGNRILIIGIISIIIWSLYFISK